MKKGMEPMPAKDSDAIIGVVQQAMDAIMKDAAELLPFPLMINVTCPLGSVWVITIAGDGTEPEFTPIKSTGWWNFPLTVTCTGAKGATLTATIEEPQPQFVTEGNA
jgi:hypothetical protein